MEDFFCQKPSEMHYKVLADRSRYLKEEKEGAEDMCKVMEELVDDLVEERAKEMAKKMLQKGKLSLEEIAEYSGLTLEEVKKLTLQLA